jgi:hypothetical protein
MPIPPYKGNEKPVRPVWDPKGGGWTRVPTEEFGALLYAGRLAGIYQTRFIWLVMNEQWAVPGKPNPLDWTEARTQKEWASRLDCCKKVFDRVKLDALVRGLVEARRDGRSLRFCARVENWAKAETAPDLHSYDEDRRLANNVPVGHYSGSALEPGSTIAIPVFSCRRLSNGLDLPLQITTKAGTIEIAGASAAAPTSTGLSTDAADTAVRIASERAAKAPEVSTSRAIADGPNLAEQVERVLAPYFIQRQFVVDRKLKRAIADAINQAGGTIEQFGNFIPGKLTSEYPWRPGLFLASGGFMDEFREFVLQARNLNGKLPPKANGNADLEWLLDRRPSA